MQQKLDALHKKLQMYKKRYQRLKKQTQKSKLNTNHLTPISRVNQISPASIWAHLAPIFNFYPNKGIEIIHFLSDSPSTQYRNKSIFSFITNHMATYFEGLNHADVNVFQTVIQSGKIISFPGTTKVHQVKT
ncbi:unnamed protein product, partial [Callosobruchus maculatus]